MANEALYQQIYQTPQFEEYIATNNSTVWFEFRNPILLSNNIQPEDWDAMIIQRAKELV